LENEGRPEKGSIMKRDFLDITSWILAGAIVLDILCFVILLVLWALRYLNSSPVFPLREMRIAGLQTMGQEELRRLAGVKWGESLLSIDIKRVCMKIKGHPWIAEVSVKKGFPDALEIKIEERKPIAAVDLGNDCYLMDRKGEIFLRVPRDEAKEYPLLTGLNEGDIKRNDPVISRLMGDAVGLVSRLKEMGLDDFDSIFINRVSGITMVSQSREISVNIGKEEFETRLDRLRAILGLESYSRLARPVSIDLSFTKQAIIRIRQEKESHIQWGKG